MQGNLAKRKWLLDHMPMLLIEAAYHREHHDSENLPETVIWEKEKEEDASS